MNLNPTKEQVAFRQWYKENAEERNERRRKQYHSDPDVRQRAIQRARQYRNERRKGRSVEVERIRMIEGEPVRVFTTGQVGERIGKTRQMVCSLEKRGLIPAPTIKGGQREYTESQVQLIALVNDALEATKKDKDAREQELAKLIPYVETNW